MPWKTRKPRIGDTIILGKYKGWSEEPVPIRWKINHLQEDWSRMYLLSEYVLDIFQFDARRPGTEPFRMMDTKGRNALEFSNFHMWMNGKGTNWWSNIAGGTAPSDTDTDYPAGQANGYVTKRGFLSSFTDRELLQNLRPDGGVIPTSYHLVNIPAVNATNTAYIPGTRQLTSPVLSYNAVNCYSGTSPKLSQQAKLYSPLASFYGDSDVFCIDYSWRTSTYTDENLITLSNGTTTKTVNANYIYCGFRPMLHVIDAREELYEEISEGVYASIAYDRPIINIIDSTDNLGNKWKKFDVKFSVTDTSPYDLSYTALVDGITHLATNISITKNTTYVITVPTDIIDTLNPGEHYISLLVRQDPILGPQTKIIKFNVVLGKIVFKTKPLETDERADSIAFNMKYKGSVPTTPPRAEIKACNNAYDTNPTWEDITEEALNKKIHTFTNTEKTDAKWGIQTHVTVHKDDNPNIEVSAVGFSIK